MTNMPPQPTRAPPPAQKWIIGPVLAAGWFAPFAPVGQQRTLPVTPAAQSWTLLHDQHWRHATTAPRSRSAASGPADQRQDAARVAQRSRKLRTVVAEDQTVLPRMLVERRDDLAHERVRITNRLHGLLRDLVPGGAALGLSATKTADLNDAICATDRCAPVIGRVVVYRDSNHLTATYALTLAPRLETALRRILEPPTREAE